MEPAVEVSTFEAKNRLSALLAEVERGVEVTITRRGVPVAKLVPAGPGFDRARARRAAAGLREIYLGVESGSRTVLKLLQKPGNPQRMELLVKQLKRAGIVVNLIFLCGAGGHELSWEHVAATTGLLKRLPLGPGDRVYLSDLEVHPESRYARLGLSPLDRWECRQQARAMRALLDYPPPPRGPAVTLYDVRQFVY